MNIIISGQYGDPKASRVFWPMQKKLNDTFEKYIKDDYFHNLIELSIVFRVSGKISNFKGDGPEKMKYLKSEPSITIDLTFPESAWRDVDRDTIKLKIVNGINSCFLLMLEKAEKLGEIKDNDAIRNDIELAISDFIES